MQFFGPLFVSKLALPKTSFQVPFFFSEKKINKIKFLLGYHIQGIIQDVLRQTQYFTDTWKVYFVLFKQSGTMKLFPVSMS